MRRTIELPGGSKVWEALAVAFMLLAAAGVLGFAYALRVWSTSTSYELDTVVIEEFALFPCDDGLLPFWRVSVKLPGESCTRNNSGVFQSLLATAAVDQAYVSNEQAAVLQLQYPVGTCRTAAVATVGPIVWVELGLVQGTIDNCRDIVAPGRISFIDLDSFNAWERTLFNAWVACVVLFPFLLAMYIFSVHFSSARVACCFTSKSSKRKTERRYSDDSRSLAMQQQEREARKRERDQDQDHDHEVEGQAQEMQPLADGPSL